MNKKSATSRRNFLKSSGAAVVGGTLAVGLPGSVFANTTQTLKVGLIGCGGRGTGAANQALSADENVVLAYMADIFPDRMEKSYNALMEAHPDKVKVPEANKFMGFDAYQKLIDSDVDVVLLATPPAFRPDHLLYAVNKKKHIFTEKPMAVDIPGLKKVYEAARIAEKNQTSLVSGFCWRYHTPKRESFGLVNEGAIGDITTIYNTYNTGYLWSYPREKKWGDLEYQLRNWIYYNWLSGDHINEQAIHSLDMMVWAMGNKMPVKAGGTGGRQLRVEEIYGNVYDHFAIVYEWENGAKGFHFSRQQKDTERAYHVEALGTEGRLMVDCIRRKHEITSHSKYGYNWSFKGKENSMYQQEHDELFASIRNGEPMNDGEWMANSTLLALWGRMVAYTGQEITLEQAMASTETLGPKIDEYDWKLKWETPMVAKPGLTEMR
ncbi:MAG: Gfo/Idh/MocA family oxidoreductase [Bacteroidetes bacterium]|nr:Gfo/Idh/MocA family oxidoreductase [Bacteroidota bacterium]